MKKVVYGDRKQFIITQKEFTEAYPEWKKGNDYFCERIDSVLSKFYSYISPEFDKPEWEHRVGVAGEKRLDFAYNKEKKELWYAENWDYSKLLDSVTGEKTYEGLIPRKVEDFKHVFEVTKSIDDYLDKK